MAAKNRPLPPDLQRQLRRARELEAAADTAERHRAAIRATAALLLAARTAGWTEPELGQAIGIRLSTVNRRILIEQRRRGGAAVALSVDEPPQPPNPAVPARKQLLARPAGERDWLTGPEACAGYGCVQGTLTQWRRAGMLPRTDTTMPTRLLYYRGDLERIRQAPHGIKKVDRRWVLDVVSRSDTSR